MGDNTKSGRQKCGDLFIHIKSVKNKAKVFTFHCTLCSMDCDQLKKFSKHLENHLEYFQNQQFIDNNHIYLETEKIKTEVELTEQFNVDGDSDVSDYKSFVAYDDPLETQKFYKTGLKSKNSNNVKNNEENNFKKCTTTSNKSNDMEKAIVDRYKQNEANRSSLLTNDFSSDHSLEYSSDPDFDFEKEFNSSRKRNLSMAESGNKLTENINESEAEKSFCNKSKRRKRIIVASTLPFLIQQYKKYEILWQVDNIAFGIKIKKYEIFTKIAEALKLEQKKIMSLEDLNYHINYLNELYAKDKEQELKCKMDKVKFIPACERYKEMSFLSKSQGPFLCSICNEILPRYHAYCQHMSQHNKTQPYKCPLCDSTFVNYHKYLVHKKRHLGILDFHCKICGKGYMFKNDLEWHFTSHTGDKPYLCPICGTSFRARHGYDNHVRRHEERFRHECHICKRGFNQLHALNSHVKSHLNIRDVICNICGKGFVHSKYLKRHELIHGKEKHYKCNECGKAFFQSCGLRAHRKNHHTLGPTYDEDN